MDRRHRTLLMSRLPSRMVAEIGSELLVVGVLAILVVLGAIRVFLPPIVLPVVGVAAFAAMLVCGGVALAAKTERRWLDIPMWGLVAALAIVWIAVDRLVEADTIEHWLSP